MFDFDHNVNEGLSNKVKEKAKGRKIEDTTEDMSVLTVEDIESILSEMVDGFKANNKIGEFDPANPTEDSILIKHQDKTIVKSLLTISIWAPYRRFINNEKDFNGTVSSNGRLEVDDPFLTISAYICCPDDTSNGFVVPFLYLKCHRKAAIVGIDLLDLSNIAKLKSFMMLSKYLFNNRKQITKSLDALYLDTCQPSNTPLIFWPTNGMFQQVSTEIDSRGNKLNDKWISFIDKLLGEVGLKHNKETIGILDIK